MSSRSSVAIPLALAAALAAGCASAPKRAYLDEQMDFGSIRTVAVLPFSNLTRDNLAADRVRDVFANALLATGAVYVVPHGEVARGAQQAGLGSPSPTPDQVMRLGKLLKADAVIAGVVREYGEVKSGTSTGNVVSISLQLFETATGKIVWSAASTQGGVTLTARLFGSSGPPLNAVTEAAVDDLLGKLF